MKKWVTIFVILFGLAFFIAFHIVQHSSRASIHSWPLVKIEPAKEIKIKKSVSAIGILKARQGVQVSASTSGTVKKIYFQSGEFIKKGELLIELSNEDLKFKLAEDLEKYLFLKKQCTRYQHLFKKGAIAKADMDRLRSSVIESKALSDFDRALLNKTFIRAPFSGDLGINRVVLGQYLIAGAPIISLYDPSKIFVDFTLPLKFSSLIEIGDSLEIETEDTRKMSFRASLLSKGVEISRGTLSQRMRAEVSGDFRSLKLLPGMLVKIRIFLLKSQSALMVPESAIQYSSEGEFVYLFRQGVVIRTSVISGEESGGYVQIKKGLHRGDPIVVAGFARLWNGASAHIKNTTGLTHDLD